MTPAGAHALTCLENRHKRAQRPSAPTALMRNESVKRQDGPSALGRNLLITRSEPYLADKVVVMKISWLIVAAVVTALCDVANAPDALACGAPGQFGGCLAHGQFDSTIN